MKKVFMSLGALTLFAGGVLAGYAKFLSPTNLYITDGTASGCHQLSSTNGYANFVTSGAPGTTQASIFTSNGANPRTIWATSTCKQVPVYLK